MHDVEQAEIPAGTFVMGDSSSDRNPADGEVPQHEVAVSGFLIDATTVTDTTFQRFVEAPRYATETK